jgi:uncharacterized protein (DUF3084 family)
MNDPGQLEGVTSGEPDAATPAGGHSRRWMWVSAVLAVVAVGLGIWALTLKSDRDDAQHELGTTQQELTSSQQKLDASEQQLTTAEQNAADAQTTKRRRTGLALGTAAAIYNQFAKELGATNDELDATQQDLEQANTAAAQAEEDAAKAKQDAANADNAADKAKAESEQVKAESEAAQSKAQAAAGCAKAYIAAWGGLFEGDNASAQAETVRKDLQGVTADCKDALAGT